MAQNVDGEGDCCPNAAGVYMDCCYPEPEECSANNLCRKQGKTEGVCCPREDGVYDECCTAKPEPPVDCQWKWSDWGICVTDSGNMYGPGQQKRHTIFMKQPEHGGAACPCYEEETRDCPNLPTQNCYCGDRCAAGTWNPAVDMFGATLQGADWVYCQVTDVGSCVVSDDLKLPSDEERAALSISGNANTVLIRRNTVTDNYMCGCHCEADSCYSLASDNGDYSTNSWKYCVVDGKSVSPRCRESDDLKFASTPIAGVDINKTLLIKIGTDTATNMCKNRRALDEL